MMQVEVANRSSGAGSVPDQRSGSSTGEVRTNESAKLRNESSGLVRLYSNPGCSVPTNGIALVRLHGAVETHPRLRLRLHFKAAPP